MSKEKRQMLLCRTFVSVPRAGETNIGEVQACSTGKRNLTKKYRRQAKKSASHFALVFKTSTSARRNNVVKNETKTWKGWQGESKTCGRWHCPSGLLRRCEETIARQLKESNAAPIGFLFWNPITLLVFIQRTEEIQDKWWKRMVGDNLYWVKISKGNWFSFSARWTSILHQKDCSRVLKGLLENYPERFVSSVIWEM